MRRCRRLRMLVALVANPFLYVFYSHVFLQISKSALSDSASRTKIKGSLVNSSSSRSELGNDLANQLSDILSLDDSDNDAKSTVADSSNRSDKSASLEIPANRNYSDLIGKIEDRLGLISQLTDADELGVNNLEPPRVVSLYEDMELTQDELLSELHRLRQELSNVYSACTKVTAALSGAETHYAIIHRQVNDLRLQVLEDPDLQDYL